MKHTALIGCVPTPWCKKCRIVLPESGLCPKCPPRVVGEVPAQRYEWESCDRCGFMECACGTPELSALRPEPSCDDGLCFGCPRCHAEYDERQKAIEPASPEGAERPGWVQVPAVSGGGKRLAIAKARYDLAGTDLFVIDWRDGWPGVFRLAEEEWGATDRSEPTPRPTPTLLAAQEAAERLAAETRPGWIGSPYRYKHEGGEAYEAISGTWVAVVWGGGAATGHPTAIAAMLAVEEALRG